MGYAVYEEPSNGRWAGYGVPAVCDWPDCSTTINRGLGYKCEEGGDKYGDFENDGSLCDGCELFFCSEHLDRQHPDELVAKPDTTEWIQHMLTDESWQEWRDKNPKDAADYRAQLTEGNGDE